MKFTTTKKDLHAALKLVAPAINNKSYSEVTKCVWIQAKDGGVFFRATDNTISVVIPLDANVMLGGDGDRLVKFKELAAVVNTFSPDSSVEFDGSEPMLRVHAGATRVDLPVLSLDNFPTFPEVAEGDQDAVSVPADKFKELARLGGYATSDEESRPLLTQVLLENTGDMVRVVTTNSHRFALASWSTGEPEVARQEFLLPPYAVRLASLMLEGQEFSISRNINHVQFDGEGGERLTVRVIGGSYPNFAAILPEKGVGSVATFNVAELASAAKLVIATCFDVARMNVKFDGPQAVVTGGDDAKVLDILAVSGSTFDDGYKACFNAQYMLEVCSRWPTEEVETQMTDPEKAMRLDLPQGSDEAIGHLALIMPMRLI